jgi:hypothetical protein
MKKPERVKQRVAKTVHIISAKTLGVSPGSPSLDRLGLEILAPLASWWGCTAWQSSFPRCRFLEGEPHGRTCTHTRLGAEQRGSNHHAENI